MSYPIILASGSKVRSELLTNAFVEHDIIKPMVDEDMILRALVAEEAPPRDIADTLAEFKARKISDKNPGRLVLGCDQVLAFEGKIFQKPNSKEELKDHLTQLQGQKHFLMSAAVIYEDGKPLWRHVGTVRLFMRNLSDAFISAYIDRNWDDVQYCVGGYQLEKEGSRLFTRIEGDYFNVLGMPLFEIINYLVLRGDLDA